MNSDVKILTTDDEIDALLEHAKSLPPRPKAVSAMYVVADDLFILKLNNGRRLVLPRELLQGLQEATEVQLADVQIFGGVDIAWPQLAVDMYLPYLLEGRYGSDAWMEQLQRSLLAA